MPRGRTRIDTALNASPDDSAFGAEVKRFALAGGLTSMAELKRRLGLAAESTVLHHLRASRRRPHRDTVCRYARLLHIPETYFLLLANYADAHMADDAKRTFQVLWEEARPLLRADRVNDLWARIVARWGNVAAAVYMEVQRDRAERDCGLRERERPALAVLREALTQLSFPMRDFIVSAKADELVNLVTFLEGAIPHPFVAPTCAFVRGLYEQCGVDVKLADNELRNFDRDPVAWIRNSALAQISDKEKPS